MSLDTARTSACATRLQKSIVYELLTQDTSKNGRRFRLSRLPGYEPRP
jgi:hypothetical protein